MINHIKTLSDSDNVSLTDLLYEVKTDGLYDGWGVCWSWLFAISDYMIEYEVEVPEYWQHRQVIAGGNHDAYEYQTLCKLKPNDVVLIRLADIMWRYRSKLLAVNKEY